MRGRIELVLFSKGWVVESAWVVEGVRAYPPARSVRPLASKNGRGFLLVELGFVANPRTAPGLILRVGLAGLRAMEMGSRVDKSRAAMVAIRFKVVCCQSV